MRSPLLLACTLLACASGCVNTSPLAGRRRRRGRRRPLHDAGRGEDRDRRGGSTQEKRDSANISGGIITGIGLAMLTMGISFLVAPAEGATIEHDLTKSQTRRFVERYNRALRKDQ